MKIENFQQELYERASGLYRDMPWRDDTRPYYVLVSELMLQQTQVARVVPKFEAFISRFSNEKILAQASLADVLGMWQGLGYNRRAKYLHDTAKIIVNELGGVFPDSAQELIKLPGIGKNTAGAILAYSFNQPALFIETNVRTVYLHHFYDDQFDVTDKQLLEKLDETIDIENPRGFYQALMDYGSWLKANGVNNISNSKHYKKQSPLKGSVREVRGQLLSLLTTEGTQSLAGLRQLYKTDSRLNLALQGLEKDGLVSVKEGKLYLTK